MTRTPDGSREGTAGESLPSRESLEGVFAAAVAAAEPGRLVGKALRSGPDAVTLAAGGPSSVRWDSVRRVTLVGGGKAGRAMGEAAIRILGGRITGGAVAVPRGDGGADGPVRFLEAGHPLPDAGSLRAAGEMLSLLAAGGADDLVVAVLSGGASAMISAPPEGVSPAEKESVARLLLRSGADIAEFNALRKHLSLVKGGRMAKASHPARVFALLLSDVPGDDPSVIASGPFSPDPTTYADALRVLVRRRICAAVPDAVRAHLELGVAGSVPETPKPGDPAFERIVCSVIGANRDALEGAREGAIRAGAGCVLTLPGFLRGEARECARDFVLELKRALASVPPGGSVVLLAGGETTVTVTGRGAGGRSQEFALAAAAALDGEEGMAVLAAGTDGVDGPTEAAGAFADGSTCARARALGLSPAAHLENNDSHAFFGRMGDLVVTGPTGTNVADIAVGAAVRARGVDARAGFRSGGGGTARPP